MFLLLALVLAIQPTPVRYLTVTPFNNAAVAAASMNAQMSMAATGLPDVPMVGVQVLYGDLFCCPSPTWMHFREFKNAPLQASRFFSSKRARGKGMMTTVEQTVVVWWID